jgi:hypothetical protein
MNYRNKVLEHLGNDILDATQVQKSITYNGTDKKLELSGDASAPGNSYYYGTSSGGVKGFYVLPSGGDISNELRKIRCGGNP